MDAHVRFEVSFCRERPTTNLTFKWSLARVRSEKKIKI